MPLIIATVHLWIVLFWIGISVCVVVALFGGNANAIRRPPYRSVLAPVAGSDRWPVISALKSLGIGIAIGLGSLVLLTLTLTAIFFAP